MTEKNIVRYFLFPAIALGASLILATAIGAYTFFQIRNQNSVISVLGAAEKIVTSDTVKWTAKFKNSVSVDELSDGMNMMKEESDVIRSYFSENEIDAKTYTISPVKFTESCRSSQDRVWSEGGEHCSAGTLVAYDLTQFITLNSLEVEKITDLAEAMPYDLIAQGIMFSSENLEYFYSQLDSLKLEILAEATKNAKLRAEQIAESTGASIGNVKEASVGVFQIVAPNSTEFENYGAYNSSTIEKKVTSTVRAAFLLK
jgi:hypothetical protein